MITVITSKKRKILNIKIEKQTSKFKQQIRLDFKVNVDLIFEHLDDLDLCIQVNILKKKFCYKFKKKKKIKKAFFSSSIRLLPIGMTRIDLLNIL